MNLTFRIDTGGMERKFALLTDSAKKVEPALRVFDRYLAARVRQRFEQSGPGWPPPAAATLERKRGAALQSLVRRLGAETWKTSERQEKRLKALAAEGKDTEKPGARFARTLQRRLGTIAELQKHIAGTAEQSLSAPLLPRVARAEARAQKQLGRIAGSFQSTIKHGTLVRESKIAWAGVHNDGGQAGHGAHIPARPFLFLEDSDVDVLVGILQNHMLIAMES